MSEQSFPIQCRECGKQLYGPVNYCPYCGVPNSVPTALEKENEARTLAPATEEKKSISLPLIASPSQFLTEHDESKVFHADELHTPSTSSPKLSKSRSTVAAASPAENVADDTHEVRHPSQGIKQENVFVQTRRRSLWKWAAGSIVIASVVVGYLMFVPARQQPVEFAETKQEMTTAAGIRRESARILVRETLSQGTALSKAISNVATQARVLEGTQKLAQASSENRQKTLTRAKNNLNAAREKRDNNLIAYLSKLIDLANYESEDFAYALEISRNGNLTAREMLVADLIAEHVEFVRKNSEADPKKMLIGFSQKFENFVD